MAIYIEDIIRELKKHGASDEKAKEVYAAYTIAERIHRDQTRQSGEPYITHPLNVANNVLKMEVYDPDTVSAALLHDTIEDAAFEYTKEDIANSINPTVAELVDGVTKMRAMSFSNKEKRIDSNTRKIINGLNKDIRIIIIKLADRLHNMSTIEWKKEERRKANAIETLELFRPLAISIGAYQIKNHLEELSLKYIDPEMYKEITEKRKIIVNERKDELEEMASVIGEGLNKYDIHNDIVFRTQSIYTIYEKIKSGYDIENMYDLSYFKILVDSEKDCYDSLYVVHKCYKPMNGRFKDYICNPRTNFYQSLHTTVAGPRKIKIRTYDMDKIAAFGIPAYWNIKDGKTIEETNQELREKSQFAKKLKEIDSSFVDDRDFIEKIKNELLTNHIYVYDHKGKTIELPSESTVMDFACEVYPYSLDKMTGVIVNGKEVSFETVLKNNDRIELMINGKNKEEKPKQLIKTINETNNTDK